MIEILPPRHTTAGVPQLTRTGTGVWGARESIRTLFLNDRNVLNLLHFHFSFWLKFSIKILDDNPKFNLNRANGQVHRWHQSECRSIYQLVDFSSNSFVKIKNTTQTFLTSNTMPSETNSVVSSFSTSCSDMLIVTKFDFRCNYFNLRCQKPNFMKD